ncbi:MAG: hypothetical protein M0Q40_04745 [Limnochordia bacterium]|nr:hypothetical protein [Limnochordia bacterium]
MMQLNDRYYQIAPKVVRSDSATEIVIRPLYAHCQFNEEATYVVTQYPTEEQGNHQVELKSMGGVLRIQGFKWYGEQEHLLVIEKQQGEEKREVLRVRIYSVAEDLYSRKPFKGDLHMHSCYSDGSESPGYVAAACRRVGLDFMAVTDHHRYAPSIEAQECFADVDIDLRIFRGEEVHAPHNPVHIVNFGGSFSINELFATDEFKEEVAQLQKTLTDLPQGVDPYQYAASVWCFNKIRQAGGLGIFCHPYWFWQNHLTPPGALTTYLFEQQPFDAYEVIGGFHRWEQASNTLQVARYHEERAKGRQIPIVGSTDAHGCERDLFGWRYTIVFAPSSDLVDLIEGVKGLYSVAVEALPGEEIKVYGPFRLVKYALFLIREVLPLHDELCKDEGRLMFQYLKQDPSAKETLEQAAGGTALLYKRLWG